MFNFKKKKVQEEIKKIEDGNYGGFIISKNVWNGVKIGYSYREKSAKAELNGWIIYSIQDDDAYVEDAGNFLIINATSMYQVDSLMLKIFDAPYGTDLCWQYNSKGDFIGFYDLVHNKNVTIKDILKNK